MGAEFSQPEASSQSQQPPPYEDARRRGLQPVPVQREAISYNRIESGNFHGRETFNRGNNRKYDSDESYSEAAGNMRIRASKPEKPKKESRKSHNYQDILEHDESYTGVAGNSRIQVSKPEKPKKESRKSLNYQDMLEHDESCAGAAGNLSIQVSKPEKPKKESRKSRNYQDILEHDESYTGAAGNSRIQVPKPEKPKKESRLPHNHHYILERADSSSMENLGDQLSAEVFLDKKAKKYGVDKRPNSNSFMLYARELSISWGENQNYWRWLPMKDESGTQIEVAKLLRVCWLEVHGRFNIKSLSPRILYQASFLVKLEDSAEGWEVPVNVRLVLPGGRKQEHEENLMDMTRMRWMEIPAGEFVVTAQDAGEMEISMYETEGGIWKTGLLIKGVVIKPRN